MVSSDPETDLEVLNIEPQAGEALPVAPLDGSNTLAVGDWVVGIRNALGLHGGPTGSWPEAWDWGQPYATPSPGRASWHLATSPFGGGGGW